MKNARSTTEKMETVQARNSPPPPKTFLLFQAITKFRAGIPVPHSLRGRARREILDPAKCDEREIRPATSRHLLAIHALSAATCIASARAEDGRYIPRIVRCARRGALRQCALARHR